MNCGVDIIEISRIRRAVEENDRFLTKVFSESEIEYFRKKGCRFECLAGFYAAKEAFAKFRGTGIKGFKLSEVFVEHNEKGRPFLVFEGEKVQASLSISHDKSHAVAIVCGNEIPQVETDDEMGKLIPKRKEDAHKGDCGRVFIVAGSRGMTGAAILSAKGALRSGCGLVTVGTPETERPIVALGISEAMTCGLNERGGVICHEAMSEILKFSDGADAVVFGPGLGKGTDVFEVLSGLIQEYKGKLVIDADGLNALSKNPQVLKEKSCRIVLTPHPGEMARLTRKSTEEIQKNRETVASQFAKEFGVCVVLKGKNTVIADENGEVKINPTGNPGMATGGTGDVLSGIVASFMAQGLDAFEGAVLGAYIHGKAGDIAAGKLGVHGLIATDVVDAIPFAIKSELRK